MTQLLPLSPLPLLLLLFLLLLLRRRLLLRQHCSLNRTLASINDFFQSIFFQTCNVATVTTCLQTLHHLFWCMYRASCSVHYLFWCMYRASCSVHYLFWCMYRASCSVHYPDQHTHTQTHIHIYKKYCICRKHCYMFLCTRVICRQSYPSTLLKL